MKRIKSNYKIVTHLLFTAGLIFAMWIDEWIAFILISIVPSWMVFVYIVYKYIRPDWYAVIASCVFVIAIAFEDKTTFFLFLGISLYLWMRVGYVLVRRKALFDMKQELYHFQEAAKSESERNRLMDRITNRMSFFDGFYVVLGRERTNSLSYRCNTCLEMIDLPLNYCKDCYD